MRLLSLIIIVLGFTSCKVGEKAVAKYKASPEFPQDCSDKFPPKFTAGTIVYVQGEEHDCDSAMRVYTEFWEGLMASVNGDNERLKDSLEAMQRRGVKIPTMKLVCPPSTHTRDTVESTAKLEAQTRIFKAEMKVMADQHVKDGVQIENLSAENKALKSSKRKWFCMFWGAIAAAIVMIFRKPIFGAVTGGVSKIPTLISGLFRKKK